MIYIIISIGTNETKWRVSSNAISLAAVATKLLL